MPNNYPKVLFVAKSTNRKTGDIPQTYTEEASCPTSCPFKGRGCYGEDYGTSFAWRRCSTHGLNLSELMDHVAQLEPRTLLRHNVAGDMAIPGTDRLDSELVYQLTSIYHAAGVMAYAYTHCRLGEEEAWQIKCARERNFVINASCETTQECDKAIDLGVPAVIACVDAEHVPATTPKGRRIVICPNQSHERVTCKSCKLCARGNRKVVVALLAHGIRRKKAREAIAEKVARSACGL